MKAQEKPVLDGAMSVPDGDNKSDPSDEGFSPATSPSHTIPDTPTVPSVPSLRSNKDMTARMNTSSTPLGQINAARRGPATQRPPLTPQGTASSRPQPSMSSAQPGGLNQDILAKMKAFSLSRQGAPSLPHAASTGTVPSVSTPEPGANRQSPPAAGSPLAGPLPAHLAGQLPRQGRPNAKNWISSPPMPGSSPPPIAPKPPGGLAAKRMKPGLKLSDATGPTNGPSDNSNAPPAGGESAFAKYAEYVDTKTGTLNFKDKAVIHGGGVEFSSGHSFSISLDEVDRLDELGKGNYGNVYQVRHSRPHMRRPGMGVNGILSRPTGSEDPNLNGIPVLKQHDNLTGVVMAMKEIRLELDESKLAQIIMELDILHRCVSPFIIDFYGAFFQEGAVYICVEFMDGGSIDKIYKEGTPENILRKVTLSTIMGLKSLKDDHHIIHRDVKPTNILVNTRGQIKICDFGVSGNLVSSIAKTNIGCQSYMAPERIAGGGMQQQPGSSGGGTYSVQSDVWSLGLSVVECAIGRYPYPPETFNNIFGQLHVSSLHAALR